MLIASGLPAKTIQARLGHSRMETTFDIYGHYLVEHDKVAADVLNGTLHEIMT